MGLPQAGQMVDWRGMDDAELQRIEEAACAIAMGAGAILLDHFTKPLNVQYKGDFNRSPVTEADHAADAYIRAQIAERFPQHAVLSEEEEDSPDEHAPATWVIDPLDGTTNFLHGLPVFGVCIAVLEGDRPVAAAIFVPSVSQPQGIVLHARAGGGAYLGDTPITINPEAGTPGRDRLMATMPSHFARMFRFRTGFWVNLGDVRSLGSVAYEMAMTVQGVLDYAVFSGPYIWDVAAGMVLIQEAGGEVLVRQGRSRRWLAFERFETRGAQAVPTPHELRAWRGGLIVGRPQTVRFAAGGLRITNNRFRRWYWRWRRRWARRRAGAAGAACGEANAAPNGSTTAAQK
jgi:myo-inositol-1(or 4)-monophosphatase